MEPFEQEILRIAEEFNRRMAIIMAVEWVAFGLSMVALALLVIMKMKERKEGRHGRHNR